MDKIVPRFPIIGPPEIWDVLTLVSATIFLEAEGEPVEGKSGVGWVIRHRSDEWKKTFHQIILSKDEQAWSENEAFSCWRADSRFRSDARLVVAEGSAVEMCWKAAAGALWRLIPDPTDGANHYLNEELTKKIRGGTLPSWFDPEKVTARIGNHTFLRL